MTPSLASQPELGAELELAVRRGDWEDSASSNLRTYSQKHRKGSVVVNRCQTNSACFFSWTTFVWSGLHGLSILDVNNPEIQKLWVQIKTNPKIHIGGTFGQNLQQRPAESLDVQPFSWGWARAKVVFLEKPGDFKPSQNIPNLDQSSGLRLKIIHTYIHTYIYIFIYIYILYGTPTRKASPCPASHMATPQIFGDVAVFRV